MEASRPQAARVARNIVATMIGLLGTLFLWWALSEGRGGFVALAAPCAIAIVGLFRWLVWARALASWILVLATFLLSGLLMGHVDEPDGVTKISHISGLTFPLWFEWLVIVVSPAVVLAPLVVMGWRQAYFKRQRW